MNREPMTTHQYENNGMGASICKVCGHLQTIPDWPFECSKVEKEPMDFEFQIPEGHRYSLGTPEMNVVCPACGMTIGGGMSLNYMLERHYWYHRIQALTRIKEEENG